MAKTTNLGLELTAINETGKTFVDYRTELSGTDSDSNMNLIDTAFGTLTDTVASNKTDANNQISALSTTVSSNKTAADDQFDDIEAELATLRLAVGSPLAASTSSKMENTNKIYVFTGETAGDYKNGYWYYYDESSHAWVEGGQYNEAAIETDKTLLVADAPADSKTVGDELTNLKSDLQHEVMALPATDDYGTSGQVPSSTGTGIEWITPDSGLSDAAKAALMDCFSHVAWIGNDGQTYYDALYNALYSDQPVALTFEQGGFLTDGLNTGDDFADKALRCRTPNYIAVEPGEYTIQFTTSLDNVMWNASFYTANDYTTPRFDRTNYASISVTTFTVPEGASYVRFLVKREDNSAITPSDVAAVLTQG